MIRTRFGTIVRDIVARCGEHTPPGCDPDVKNHLLLVELADPMDPDKLMWTTYRFAELLRADEGWPEIEAAMSRVGLMSMTDEELEKAIQEAL